MKYEYYEKHINKKTNGRYDLTTLFENKRVFSNLINDIIKPFENKKIDKIAGLDAIGFIIGGAVAQKTNKGFLAVRKGGKLPGIKGTVKRAHFTDYTKTRKSIEINKASIKKGDRILLVDEWIETGAQMKSAAKLIESLGGHVVGISVLAAEKNKNTKLLFEKYTLKAIKEFN